MTDDPKPLNQETDPRYNQEPGLVLVPGSPIVRLYSKFEQHPSQYTVGTQPGNPYVYRAYPKMLYRAEHFNGKPLCMAAPPDPYNYKDNREYEQHRMAAEKFTERCQLIVGNEVEQQRAMENGWRESPQAAVEYLLGRDRGIANETAERLYQDRNMSEGARREAALVTDEAGGDHQPEITGRKVAEAKDGRRRRSA